MASISAIKPSDIERPVLELSGDALRAGIQVMVAGAEEHGGIERYVDALKLKSNMFQQAMERFQGITTLQLVSPLRDQLREEGFDILFEIIIKIFNSSGKRRGFRQEFLDFESFQR